MKEGSLSDLPDVRVKGHVSQYHSITVGQDNDTQSKYMVRHCFSEVTGNKYDLI